MTTAALGPCIVSLNTNNPKKLRAISIGNFGLAVTCCDGARAGGSSRVLWRGRERGREEGGGSERAIETERERERREREEREKRERRERERDCLFLGEDQAAEKVLDNPVRLGRILIPRQRH
jgi:hypothetical protein